MPFRLTIGRKLGLSFGLVITLLLCVCAVGYISNVHAAKNVDEINAMTKDTAIGADASVAMLMARMNVKDFLIRNQQPDLDEYADWKDKLDHAIAESRSHFQNPRRIELLNEIEADLKQYDTAFARVCNVIQTRNQLRFEVLDVVGKRATDELKAVNYDLLDHGRADLARQLTPAMLDFLEARLYVIKFMQTSAEPDYQRAHTELEHAEKKLATAMHDIGDSFSHPELDKALVDIKTYSQTFDRVHELVIERNMIVHDQLDVIGPHIAALQYEIQESLVESGEQIAQAANEEIVLAETMILIVSGVAAVLGIAVSFLITRLLVVPIRRYIAQIRQIGQGDLTQRLSSRMHNEIGDMGKGINGMVETMAQLISKLQEAAVDVADTATELAASSEQMSLTMQQEAKRVTEVESSLAEMSDSVQDVARKAAEAASNAEQSKHDANHGGKVVTETIDGMQAISQAVAVSVSSVEELGRRGEKIGEVIDVINDIADQTNLLALNAAIEAARAGEHGRGFAVVADEVRKLADRTTQATEEVGASIESMQSETSHAVDLMKAGPQQVQVGVEKAETAGESLQRIMRSNSEISGMIHGIAATTEEQSSTSGGIVTLLQKTTHGISETAEASAQSYHAIAHLSEKAEELQQLTATFKLRD